MIATEFHQALTSAMRPVSGPQPVTAITRVARGAAVASGIVIPATIGFAFLGSDDTTSPIKSSPIVDDAEEVTSIDARK